MKLIQIVGYKNSGKTTLISHLIQSFSNTNQKVATLKHHGHGGAPSEVKNTDSQKHRQAGAIMSGVEGDGVFQLSIEQVSWDMDQLLSFYKLMAIDVLFLEGFKKKAFPKLVVIRKKQDVHLLEELTGIQAVVTSLPLEDICDYPILRSNNQVFLWLTKHLHLFANR